MSNMREVSLRPAGRHDAEHLFEWRRLDDVDQWMFSEPPTLFDAHVKWLESQLERTDRWLWIIEVEGNPVGLVTLAASDDPGKLDLGIYVADAASRGVGMQALTELLSLARSQRMGDCVRADVFADNARAINLYERIGFVKVAPLLNDRVKRGVVRAVIRFEKDLGDGKAPSNSGVR